MKRIILSIATIALVGSAVVGFTGAFFGDTETSTGNTFTAGAIDLTVDNHAWYNGLECTDEGNTAGEYTWQGDQTGDPYLDGLLGAPCESSWELDDLDGHLFFNFDDLKPGDWEEDTISLHLNNNDAWMCANLAVTSNDDNSSTEPELEDGDVEDEELDEWDGELAQELNFIFWADDGDNVLEDNENVVLSGTPNDLINGQSNSQTFPIADSESSIFDGPVPGDEVVYIGKAFCFGELTQNPVAQDVLQEDDPETNSPAIDPGFSCSGLTVNNISQTDGMTGDLTFTALQSRNNADFLCSSLDEPVLPGADVALDTTWSFVDLDDQGGDQGKEWFAKARNNNSGYEISVGIDDAGVTKDTAEATWQASTDYPFTLSYDGSQTATFSVDGQTPVQYDVGPGTFGRIGINAKASNNVTTEIVALSLSSVAPLSVDTVTATGSGGNSVESLTISSPTINGAWTLSGTFRFSGLTGSDEYPAMQISID